MNMIHKAITVAVFVATPIMFAQFASAQTVTESNKQEIEALLNHQLSYPSMAERQGKEGVVRYSFTLDQTGNVKSASILRSSGSALLDMAALEAIRNAAPYPAPESGSNEFYGRIEYRLD